MQLADAELARDLRPEADAEVDEVLADAGPLDEADVVAEVVADAEQRVLRVQRSCRSTTIEPLPAISPPADAGRERLREKPVDAERPEEAEVRVDAGDLVVVASSSPSTGATGRSRRRRELRRTSRRARSTV